MKAGVQLLFLAGAALAAPAPYSPAGGPPALTAVAHPESRIFLNGTTNIGAWRCQSTKLGVNFRAEMEASELAGALARLDARTGAPPLPRFSEWAHATPPTLRLSLPVNGLDCGNAAMEHDLRKVMKAKQFPNISFDLIEIDSIKVEQPGLYKLSIIGALRLAGAEQVVQIEMQVKREGDRFRFTAELPMKMTRFGLQPPTALFGMIKARDELLIRFDVTLSPAAG